MALFDQHVNQAKKNLIFLKDISDQSKHFDWQVTACFYTAVHLMNAHLAICGGFHFRSHKATQDALNPHINGPCKIEEDIFNLYLSLYKLSRRSRYLCDEEFTGETDEAAAYLTLEKHVGRAINRLSTIMDFFQNKYNTPFDKMDIVCPKVKHKLKENTQQFFVTTV